MDQQTLLYIMAGAVTVSAVALVIQMFLLFGMYKAVMKVQEQALGVIPKVEGILESARVVLEEGRATVTEIRSKSNLILDSGHKQMLKVETLLNDVTERTNRQLAYAEAVVQDTISRVEGTVQTVHRGVMKPLRGVAGVAAGVSAALQYLMSRRPNPQNATLDEEMFI
jgi:hypothetical protein